VITDAQGPSIQVDELAGEPVQHLVELVSVEEDGHGDELTAIWEVEPGARVLEQATLPTPVAGRFDDPSRLDAFLDAVRWGAITSADSKALQAPFRSGITIEDYQLDPVVRALDMPRVNLLIADDVGLGKTIEAGLVAQELLLRHRARTILIVCPASLTLKWQGEMANRFGLEFRIIDSQAIRDLRRTRGIGANPFTTYPRLIVSIDWLKRERGMRLLGDVLPPSAQHIECGYRGRAAQRLLPSHRRQRTLQCRPRRRSYRPVGRHLADPVVAEVCDEHIPGSVNDHACRPPSAAEVAGPGPGEEETGRATKKKRAAAQPHERPAELSALLPEFFGAK